MNFKEAKKVSIIDFLQSRGKSATKQSENDFWYCSPFRNEKTASFHVDGKKNTWYDHGAGTGGDLIDLVCKMGNVNKSGALEIISGTRPATPFFSFHPQKDDSSPVEIKHVHNLQNVALVQYVESRGIPSQIAANYIKEAYWLHISQETGEIKNYFALAFQNDLGGYELRNKYFKGCSRLKTITTIPGGTKRVNVFEGFMDFLSALVYFKTIKSASTTIVLNGTGQVNKILDLLPGYEKINLYLDNDTAGKEATKRILDKYPDAVNQSQIIYPDSKDFNEFINHQ